MDPEPPLLSVERLTAGFEVNGHLQVAVREASFEIRPGETLGLVGESGCGKTVAALSILRLLRGTGRITGGRVVFQGRDLLALEEDEIRGVRGAGIGFVFQEPMSALNPVFSVGDHVAEAMVVHGAADWPEARRRAIDLLAAVRMPDPERSARAFPHQLSGGMRQRVMIAVALACRPPLVIADEPTTALDATIQAEILDLLAELRERFRLALLLISHDLGVIAGMAHRVAVMYAGQVVEEAPVRRLLQAPQHPYTRALLAATIRRGAAPSPALDGASPGLPVPATGCPFAPRCPDRLVFCAVESPPVHELGEGHRARCHLHAPRADHAAR